MVISAINASWPSFLLFGVCWSTLVCTWWPPLWWRNLYLTCMWERRLKLYWKTLLYGVCKFLTTKGMERIIAPLRHNKLNKETTFYQQTFYLHTKPWTNTAEKIHFLPDKTSRHNHFLTSKTTTSNHLLASKTTRIKLIFSPKTLQQGKLSHEPNYYAKYSNITL